MLPINKVKDIISRYQELEKILSQSNIDKNTYVKIPKNILLSEILLRMLERI